MYEVIGIAYGSSGAYKRNVCIVVCAETEEEVRLILANEYPVRIEVQSIKAVVGRIYHVPRSHFSRGPND